MSPPPSPVLALVLALALAVGSGLWLSLSCRPADPPAQTVDPPAEPPATVVLISLDTTRADALGAWQDQLTWRPDLLPDQRPQPSTPVLNALAARGTRFAWALAQAPTTLSSHATLMSGLGPHGHRVASNGTTVPADVPLLAPRLQAAGWSTIASVGSSILSARMGLSRGFDSYLAPQPGRADRRSAAQVTDAALAAVDGRSSDEPAGTASLFVFANYYDAHMPWGSAGSDMVSGFVDPAYDGAITGGPRDVGLLGRAAVSGRLSDADARQARGLYLAQVSVVDLEVGRLLDGLQARSLLAQSLVIVVADHGETLDERQTTHPYGHGPDVDLVDIHVPMIWAGSGRFGPKGQQPVPAGLVVQRQVRLVDVAPTLVAWLDLPAIGQGEDLRPLLAGQAPPAPPALAEATRAAPGARRAVTAQWPNLDLERSVTVDGHTLIVQPEVGTQGQPSMGLFTLDAGQTQVVDVARSTALLRLVEDWDAGAPAARSSEPSAETQRALQSLGYSE